MPAVCAIQREVRGRSVNELAEVNIAYGDFAGAATATLELDARLGHAPAPGLNVNLILVVKILGFAFDAVELEKHVNSHESLLEIEGMESRKLYLPMLRAAEVANP